ncbi:MAG: DHHA1 domain-containing protein, partial [Anaerolineales bacterium]
LSPQKLTAQHISHLIAPRLNAAGRLESAMAALNLLTTDDPALASKLAQELDNQNRHRQELTHQYEEIAIQQALLEDDNPYLLVATHSDFNLGVIGLVASHLTERFYRPAIVASVNDEFIRASCRSIPELNITETLDECVDLMEHHGGHAAAAGFTIKRHLFPELLSRLRNITENKLKDKTLQPTIIADSELDLNKSIDFFQDLEYLQPTGIGNPPPLFVTRNLIPQNPKQVGKDLTHLRFQVNGAYPCIAFNKGEMLENFPNKIDILYSIEQNDFNGSSYLQLVVRDIKPSQI